MLPGHSKVLEKNVERKYLHDVMVGAITTSIVIYILNLSGVLIFSFPQYPGVQLAMTWVYENLHYSVIAFSIVFILYTYHLAKLNSLLNEKTFRPAKIMQTEHMVEIWSGLFFGIGVIWTAIGMRSALLSALGGLNAETAAQQGAFVILQRLVDGGILLSLSTTIFGGIGGYLMRTYKTIKTGSKMQIFYTQMQQKTEERLFQHLINIELKISELNTSQTNNQLDIDERTS
jgi:hypothetical protein